MAPARNILRRHCNSYGSFSADDDAQPELYLVSALMAEKTSRSRGKSTKEEEEEEEEERKGKEEEGSSSKEGDESYQGWLQLGIGSSLRRRPSSSNTLEASLGRESGSVAGRKRHLTELDLFSDQPPDSRPVQRPSGAVAVAMSMAPLFPGTAAGGGYAYRLGVPSPSSAASSSTAPLPMSSSHSWGEFTQYPLPSPSSSEGLDGEMLITMRVVRPPPPRPQAGVWCMLQAAHNQ